MQTQKAINRKSVVRPLFFLVSVLYVALLSSDELEPTHQV